MAIKHRSEMTDGQITRKSGAVEKLLVELPEFRNAGTALFYYPRNSEVDTRNLMKNWILLNELYLPKLEKDNSFKAIRCRNLTAMDAGRYGIPEPSGNEEAGRLEIIIIPGLAFDESGNRIGMGKGYYDRFLSRQKGAVKIALAYESQILAGIPKEPYDVPVDMIVTEKRVIRCQQ